MASERTVAEEPAWHDKPNAEGWWLRRDRKDNRPYWHRVTDEDQHWATEGRRWFGPIVIPEDK